MDTAASILDLGLVLLAAAGFGWVARRAGLPAVVGYLLLGVVVSPFTPGYVADRHQIQLLADIGVVLLLFEVGVEVNIPALRAGRRALLWVVPAQVLLSTALAGAAIHLLGVPAVAAATLGLGVGMSSSVVIVNMTRSRRRTTDTDTNQVLLAWSVLQDVTGVAVGAVLLAVAGTGGRPPAVVIGGLAVFGLIAAATAWALPRLLARLRDEHDLFLIVSVATALAVSGVGAIAFGLPLALAAFVGGVAITESPVSAEFRRHLVPFRDLFAVLFFVAIGMLVDPGQLAQGLGWVPVFLGLVIVAKIAVAYGLARLARIPARPLQLAVGLGQMGEFSFVLASALAAASTIDTAIYVPVVASVAISIAISAVAVRWARPRARTEPAAT